MINVKNTYRKIRIVLILILFFRASFSSYAFFSDINNGSVLIQSGNIGTSILDVALLDMASALYTPDDNNETGLILFDGCTTRLKFTVKNIGSAGSKIRVYISLNFDSNALDENSKLLIYPSEISDEEILESLSTGDDSSAIAGFDANSTNIIESSTGEKYGISACVLETLLDSSLSEGTTGIATNEGESSVLCEYKIIFWDDGTLQNDIKLFNNESLEINIDAYSNLHNSENSWKLKTSSYLRLRTKVIDTTPPIITLNGPDAIYLDLGDTYIDQGAVALDNMDNEVNVEMSGDVNTSVIGSYPLKYIAEDSSGNISEKYRYIIVRDSISPVITPSAETFDLFKGTEVDLQSFVTVTDNYDTNVSDNLQVTSIPEFDSSAPGEYVISYNASDSSGNYADEVSIKIVVYKFVKVDAGYYHTIALTSHGKVYTWGLNTYGRLGDGTTTQKTSPAKLELLDDLNIIDIAANYASSFALTDDGKVYAWGYNANGCLGSGNTTESRTPSLIGGILEDVKVKQISSKYGSVVAVDIDGNVYTWGQNDYAQLGDGTKVMKSSPLKLNIPDNIVAVSQGWWHTLALSSEGHLYGWGTNREGELGLGNTTEMLIPTLIDDSLNINKIICGSRYTMLITKDNNLYVTGYNTQGQLGIDNTTQQKYIVQNTYITNAIQIAAGYEHSAVITSDNMLYTFGYNTYGRLGLGDTTRRLVPTLVGNLDSVIFAAHGYEFSIYLTEDGDIYGCGNNTNGQLGDGTTTTRNIPTKIDF